MMQQTEGLNVGKRQKPFVMFTPSDVVIYIILIYIIIQSIIVRGCVIYTPCTRLTYSMQRI